MVLGFSKSRKNEFKTKPILYLCMNARKLKIRRLSSIFLLIAFFAQLLTVVGTLNLSQPSATNNWNNIDLRGAASGKKYPFTIDGDAELAAEEGNLIVDGDGSSSDPYVFGAWEIDGTGNTTCIKIMNTSKYFKLYKNVVENSTVGIELINCSYVNIEMPTIANVSTGIRLRDCEEFTIAGAELLYGNHTGITSSGKSRIGTIEECEVENFPYGFQFNNSDRIMLGGCSADLCDNASVKALKIKELSIDSCFFLRAPVILNVSDSHLYVRDTEISYIFGDGSGSLTPLLLDTIDDGYFKDSEIYNVSGTDGDDGADGADHSSPSANGTSGASGENVTLFTITNSLNFEVLNNDFYNLYGGSGGTGGSGGDGLNGFSSSGSDGGHGALGGPGGNLTVFSIWNSSCIIEGNSITNASGGCGGDGGVGGTGGSGDHGNMGSGYNGGTGGSGGPGGTGGIGVLVDAINASALEMDMNNITDFYGGTGGNGGVGGAGGTGGHEGVLGCGDGGDGGEGGTGGLGGIVELFRITNQTGSIINDNRIYETCSGTAGDGGQGGAGGDGGSYTTYEGSSTGDGGNGGTGGDGGISGDLKGFRYKNHDGFNITWTELFSDVGGFGAAGAAGAGGDAGLTKVGGLGSGIPGSSGTEGAVGGVGTDYGVYFDNCADGNVTRNQFNSSTNYDNGVNSYNTTVIGNYWSAYSGLDVSPQDGIGDSPYMPDGCPGSGDERPLLVSFYGDYDEDGLNNWEELFLEADGYVTNVTYSDSDYDGLSDYWEYMNGSYPLDPDSDDDLLEDGSEIAYGSGLFEQDSDGDTILDGVEVHIYGTDPASNDSDSDDMTDDFEISYELNPLNAMDAASDEDADGLTALTEYNLGTDPKVSDTDDDNYLDNEEVYLGTSPTDGNDYPDLELNVVSISYESESGLAPVVLYSVDGRNRAQTWITINDESERYQVTTDEISIEGSVWDNLEDGLVVFHLHANNTAGRTTSIDFSVVKSTPAGPPDFTALVAAIVIGSAVIASSIIVYALMQKGIIGPGQQNNRNDDARALEEKANGRKKTISHKEDKGIDKKQQIKNQKKKTESKTKKSSTNKK